MTAADRDDLAVEQARDTAALARALVDHPCPTCKGNAWMPVVGSVFREEWCRDCGGSGIDKGGASTSPAPPLPCSWGDDAWHRAVNRLIRLHRPDYRQLLAEERGKR